MATNIINFTSSYPFDTGAGATVNESMWRAMASNWSVDGVIASYGNAFSVSSAWSGTTYQIGINSGAVLIQGTYGAISTNGNMIQGTAGGGMVVAQLDPLGLNAVGSVGPIIELVWVPGSWTPIQNQPGVGTSPNTSVWQLPLYGIDGSNVTWDLRPACGAQNIIGEVIDYAGASSSLPLGYVLCQGQSLARAMYPALFAAIGTTWGYADGTHFYLPQMSGRVSIGAGPAAGNTSARTLGQGYASTNGLSATSTGEETHTLTTSEMPSHNHATSNSGTGFYSAKSGSTAGALSGGTGVDLQGNTANSGSGSAHNNMQPWTAVNKAIRII